MFVGAAASALLLVRHAEARAIDAEIAEEMEDLRDVYARAGLPALQAMIAARQRDPSIWEYRVEDGRGVRLSGDLPALPYPQGWWRRRLVEGDEPGGESELVRALTRPLDPGSVARAPGAGMLRITVGEDVGARERTDNGVLASIAGVALAAAALGVGAGVMGAGRLLRQVEAMAAAVERFGAGERTVRIPLPDRPGSDPGSDLDQLAAALNAMMTRTSRLMDGLRQVSMDIAHDLRRPLTRHNQQIARTLQAPPSLPAYRQALEAAAEQVDEVLQTFQALMQIAELEAGAPGLELQPVDLCDLARRIVDAYAPMAEEGGRTLTVALPQADGQASVLGEPRIMGRMLANLVENALAHTPPGARVQVKVEAAGPKLIVADDGPGVPDAERERILERFVRLDASRSTPGAGLGLALASAAVAAFHGRLQAEDAKPGLRMVADFSPQP